MQNLVQYEENFWVRLMPHILKCMSASETKLKAILVLMDAAQVPWSNKFTDIFKGALQYSHPLVSEVREKIESQAVYTVLQKYQCSRTDEVCDFF